MYILLGWISCEDAIPSLQPMWLLVVLYHRVHRDVHRNASLGWPIAQTPGQETRWTLLGFGESKLVRVGWETTADDLRRTLM